MSAEQRRAWILSRTRETGIVRIPEAATSLGVSTMTIRRDLSVLSERGLVQKITGGAIASRPPDFASSFVAPVEAAAGSKVGNAVPRIGMVVPSGDYYFPPIIAGARTILDARKIRRALAISRYEPPQDEVLVRQLLGAGSNGFLLAPNVGLDEICPGWVEWLSDLAAPVVLIERVLPSTGLGSAWCSVRTDHELGCEKAVRHLAELGHRAVGLVTHGGTQTGARVIDGWRRAVERYRMDDAASPLIVEPAVLQWPPTDAMDRVLDVVREAAVTAAIAHGDKAALALVHHAQSRGWRIPDDLSVISYDDEIADLADPPLTAIAPPKQWIGQTAASLLLEVLEGSASEPVRHITAEPDLISRGSTSPPR